MKFDELLQMISETLDFKLENLRSDVWYKTHE